MAVIIKSDGTVEKAVPVPKINQLKFLQKVVGGYIEIVPTKEGTLIVLNEEGKLLNLQHNKKATNLYINGHEDPIVGDVIILKHDELI